MTPEELRAELRRRTKNPHVIERILRLNPNGVKEGAIPRGWRDGDRRRKARLYSASMTRGDVMREHGRAVWLLIPRSAIQKAGRREYVGRHHVLNAASDLACAMERIYL
jgi:hypothetical protein